MIVIFKNEKIYAVDKKLLQELNTTFENLNSTLSSIEFTLCSLQNQYITIEHIDFRVKQIDILAIDNLKIFKLTKLSQNKFEESIEIQPTLDTKQEVLEPNFEPKMNYEENLTTTTLNTETIEENKSLSPSPDFSINNTTEEKPLDELTPLKEENVIRITFESENKEISNILSMNKEEIQELMKNDLEKASNDLGIDIQTLSNLTNDLIKQIEDNKNNFYTALENYDYKKLHEISHSLKGAALNLRLSNIALILKYIDEKSKAQESIDTIEDLINKFYTFIQNIKGDKQNIQLSNEMKNLIAKTIQNYTATQNLKKFKKDLKYIEKILGIKIETLEELQNIIKGS